MEFSDYIETVENFNHATNVFNVMVMLKITKYSQIDIAQIEAHPTIDLVEHSKRNLAKQIHDEVFGNLIETIEHVKNEVLEICHNSKEADDMEKSFEAILREVQNA